MTKNTKTLLTVGVVAVAGYLLWKKFGNKATTMVTKKSLGFTGNEDYFNVTGRRAMGGGFDISTLPDCGSGCTNSKCKVPVYDAQGSVTFVAHYCEGTSASQIGGVINPTSRMTTRKRL